jgi:hypothetical protein
VTGWLEAFWQTIGPTLTDVVPIALVLFGFQYLVLRRPIPNLPRVVLGFVLVVLGLVFFLEGLEQALFPLGRLMAESLTSPAFLGLAEPSTNWRDYLWIYLFGASLGFATTIAEPALIAVALKASQVSGGAISPWGLRAAVAVGAATGITLGCLRIVTGAPLPWLIVAGYLVLLVQTWFAPRAIIALAYDSGGVTTSTVTVPLVAALGLGLASNVPGRSPVMDGFGMIALTALFPIMTVLAYAQLGEWLGRRRRTPSKER